MVSFLEERLPENIDYGSSFASNYANNIINTIGGNEYRSQLHPFIKATLTVDFERQTNFVVSEIVDLNNRAGGTLRGFRVLHPVDFSTNNYRDNPTAFDQGLILDDPSVPGVYQLMRWYGDSTDPECARRRIRKPQAGTVKVAIADKELPSTLWTVDTTTGLVTLAANKTDTVAGITKAVQAVVDVGTNTFVIGETIVFSDVVGMTQINGLRGAILAKPDSTHITVDINTLSFDAYVSGGTVQTRPISTETVYGGCKYDLPMRFSADLSGAFSNWDTINADSIQLIEILNP